MMHTALHYICYVWVHMEDCNFLICIHTKPPFLIVDLESAIIEVQIGVEADWEVSCYLQSSTSDRDSLLVNIQLNMPLKISGMI